jgi:excisionase family DNA binding protein
MPFASPTEVRSADRYFTSREVGDILQVTASSVVKWINDGLLNAFRTPGGHRRVPASELVRFALHHEMPIPHELRELASMRVLVVDGDARFLSAVQRACKPFSGELSVQTVDNGIDALMLTGKLKPEVLVLDLRMSGLDGFEVLERIKTNPEAKTINVIALSGQGNAATVERCRELGAVSCLPKPVRVSELLETLRDLRKARRV